MNLQLKRNALAASLALTSLIWAASDLSRSWADTTTALGSLPSKGAAALAQSNGAEREELVAPRLNSPARPRAT